MWEVMEEIILEMVSEIRFKDYLYNKAKESKSKEDWEILKQKKNKVKKPLAPAKENFLKEKLDKHEGNPRKFWRTINDISGLGKNKNGRKCTKVKNEEEVLENLEAATFLNDFYINVGPSLAQKQIKKWDKEKSKIKIEISFSFSWVPEPDMKKLVKDICITKSSAMEEINSRLLKDAFEVLTFELTYLYNS